MSTLSYQSTIRPGLVERTTTLAVITVVGFVGNLILLVTICQSASLRAIHFNRHIISMAIINLLTCILGLPMVIGFTVTSEWDYGSTLCKIIAHFILTTSIATCFNILFLNIDRVIAISNPERYALRMSRCKTALMILIVWIAAILFPLPLTLGVVPTAEFGSRYICSIAAGSDINYLISLYSVCFALPAITNVLCFVYIAREALSEKEAESVGVSTRSTEYRLWPEVQAAGVVFILFLLWVLSELPYFTLTSVEQYIHSNQVNGQFQYSADLDTAFMWLKFCDCCLLPFVIFKWRKDVWLKFKDLMFCRKRNSVLDSSPRMKDKSNGKNRLRPAQSTPKADTPKFEASFPIPTIKASKDGLHVHGNVEDDDMEGTEVFYADLNTTKGSKEFDAIGVTTATIERYGVPHHVQDGHEEETSDYETDPYSQSDPISVRSAASSQPKSSDSKDFRTKANSLSHDSGNGSASSSVKKKRRKHRAVADLCIEDTPPLNFNEDAISSPRVDHVDGLVASHTDRTNKTKYMEESVSSHADQTEQTKHKSKSKQSEIFDEAAAALGDVEQFAEEGKPKSQKKKRKKKRQNVSDAQTNTSQVINVEMMERIIPPPRLEPIKADVLQCSMATPPLRSKFPKDQMDSELVPSSEAAIEKKRKRRSGDKTRTGEDGVSTERSRKKSSRPRNKSGDSERALMSSSASSEMVSSSAVVDQHLMESQI